jgi:response regulator RpfG family c-di-GMP phosphodiesterase
MSLPNNSARILIADDDTNVRGVLNDFLSQRYECSAVGSAEAALALLGAERFHLVLSDIAMEGMSGLELIPHVRALAPGAVIIMVSGSQTTEVAVEAMRAGAFDYVLKPFDLEHLEVAVGRALEHQRLVESKQRYEGYLESVIEQRTTQLDRALQSLEDAYRTTLRALINALETRDAETHGHSERVVAFSLRLGREIGIGEEQLTALEFGSLLHDIGKIGVPDAILRKPAALTDDEWAEMRLHPAHGQQILCGIEFLEGASRVVAQHHEKWDGSGYPRGLKGEEIDPNARIFAVADAFDAMTSERVYRVGRAYELAADELDRCAGKQFDPAVVEAFRRIPRGEWDDLCRRRTSEGRARTPRASAAGVRGHARGPRPAVGVRTRDGALKIQRAGAH